MTSTSSNVANESYREWKGWTPERFATFNGADGVYFAAELRRSGIAGGRLLEIGFGSGGFAAWASRQANYEYSGIEADDDLVACARAAGLRASPASEEWARPGSYDAIVAFDVLEHIPLAELPDLFRKIRVSLRKGGLFLARFPSGDSPFSRHYQHGDTTHHTTIGTGIVKQLASQSGLQVAAIRPAAFPIFGLGVGRAIRRTGAHVLRWLLDRFLRATYYKKGDLVIAPHMVIVLRNPG
jgi:2-polyprenyl-3-methyl-5-hydroxy-6-metoxy-1,4-benzoquinol methylase